MDRASIETLGLVPGAITEIVLEDDTRYVGFYIDVNDTHIRLRQTQNGRLPGILNIPLNDIETVFGATLTALLTRSPA